jgi:hypothetical protein
VKLLGLYINKNKHPDVFKSSNQIAQSNQTLLKKNLISELLDEQQAANVSLNKAINEIKLRFLEHENVEVNHWEGLTGQLNDLRNNSQMQKEFISQLIDWLKTLDEKNSRLETANQHLSSQIQEQITLQKKLSEDFSKQEEFQAGVLNRLDKQEALAEKISRQLNHIRSILFERTNYLAEKIDEGYKITSSYVYNLMTGREKPLTFYLMNNKKEEKQK